MLELRQMFYPSKIFVIAAIVFIFPFWAFAATFVTEPITTDTTWTATSSPYVIDNLWLSVSASATLTVEPGVIVKFGERSFLDVYGTLKVLGANDNKIYFTSLKDDSLGGDTNGDGDATQPSPYNVWRIQLMENSGPHLLKNLEFGYSNDPLNIIRTVADIENIGIHDTLAVGIFTVGAEVKINNINGTSSPRMIFGWGGDFEINGINLAGNFQSGAVLFFMDGAKATIENLKAQDFKNGVVLGLFDSDITVTNSVFSGAVYDNREGFSYSGIRVARTMPHRVTRLLLKNSLVENFHNGGFWITGGDITLENDIVRNNNLGIKVEDFDSELTASTTIRQSSITGNADYGIYSTTAAPIDARNNWWGDGSGPFHSVLNPDGLGDEVSDNVDFSGWLSSDPLAEAECCSSVVFIPGLEASRLYRPGAIFENQLWEPNTNDDVRALALDPITGESVNTDIYTDDVIDEAFSVNIYKNFLAFMENMATAGDIADFETFPYDWRLDVKDVVGRAVLLRNGSSYEMIPRLRVLAAASQTGKVTLIAHSNGGLVAKELLNALKDSGDENLVDRVILVATPELGTPKAVLEMLHGMEPFAFNFPREEVTRELAENMKSAYALLPSAEYFNRLGFGARPLIEFSTTTDVTSPFREIYGETISSYGDLRQFILGDNGARPEPPAAAVNLPNVLKGPFLTQAETRHTELDAWQPPTGIDVVRIIGWGLETPRGIAYKSTTQNVCNADLSVCFEQEVLDPEPLLTAEGDGTVVYLSADALGGERYYVNMFDYNEQQNTVDRDHKNILEIEPLRNLISTLVKSEATTTLPAFTFTEKPDKVSAAERLRIAVHSPVALHIYDSLERHTGPIPNPDLSSDIELSEEQIPNSYYWRLGEGQYAGAGGTATTSVKLVGTALGSATVGIERIVGDETIISALSFEAVPITVGGLATIEVVSNAEPTLLLDVDGDGVVDAEITTDGFSSDDLIAILKSVIKTLDLPNKKEKQILKVIDKLEKELAKEHKKEKTEKLKTKQAFKHLLKLIEQYQKKKVLSAEEASELLGLIEDIMNKMVK